MTHATELVTTCEACGNLLAEIRAIAAATRGLPAPVRVAARDFRISPDRASSLARGAGWRRILRPFGREGYAAIRPLAAMFSTLGVAGLMLAALPLLPFAGGTASLDTVGGGAQVREAPAAASPEQEFRLFASPTVEPLSGEFSGDAEAGAASEPTDGELAGASQAPAATEALAKERSEPPAPLLPVSLVFLGAGLGLFLLQRAARRLR